MKKRSSDYGFAGLVWPGEGLAEPSLQPPSTKGNLKTGNRPTFQRVNGDRTKENGFKVKEGKL